MSRYSSTARRLQAAQMVEPGIVRRLGSASGASVVEIREMAKMILEKLAEREEDSIAALEGRDVPR